MFQCHISNTTTSVNFNDIIRNSRGEGDNNHFLGASDGGEDNFSNEHTSSLGFFERIIQIFQRVLSRNFPQRTEGCLTAGPKFTWLAYALPLGPSRTKISPRRMTQILAAPSQDIQHRILQILFQGRSTSGQSRLLRPSSYSCWCGACRGLIAGF